MNHLGTIPIETDRLHLRPLTLDDAQMMFDNWASDPQATAYVTWDAYANVDHVRERLAILVDNYSKTKAFYDWGIIHKESQQLIATFSIVSISDPDESLELGYIIGRPWWGQGLVAEAGQAVLDFAFTQVKANQVHACFDVRNPASGKVMEKLGMTYEGSLREARKVKGEFVTISLYAILARDYFLGK